MDLRHVRLYSLQPQGQQSDCHCSDNFGRSITTKQVTRRAEVSYKLIDVKGAAGSGCLTLPKYVVLEPIYEMTYNKHIYCKLSI